MIVLAAVYMLSCDAADRGRTVVGAAGTRRVVFVLLFPIGLLLGVFLPTGMDSVVATADATGAEQGRLVAWCWAVNGFFSVLGASLTTVMSMAFGFDRAVLAGLVLYVVATSVLLVGGTQVDVRRAPTAEPAPDPDGLESSGLVSTNTLRAAGDARQ